MVQAQKSAIAWLAIAGASLLVSSQTSFAQEDPPSRVARLNYTTGNVSMEPAGVDDWGPADVNRPFTTGDYLYADQNAAAELHLDVAVIRIASQTSFGFLNLDDRTVQLKLTEGDMYIRVHNFAPDQVFEVDTPNAAVSLLRDGVYRFRVDANGSMSFVVVRQGQAQITGPGQAFTLNADNSATLTGTDQLAYDIEVAPQPDEFDQWCRQRDAREVQLESARYLPPTMIGYEDLDANGVWQETGAYGAVWYPRTVYAGWAPYQNGHWVWIAPWGWTWVDSAPWGFAPFHYGRWAYIGNRWGWCPGPVIARGPVRPYYAPALVAWFSNGPRGGSGSGAPSLGWVPLGWGEVYTPAYRCSPRYFKSVNVNNTRIVNTVNITNVYQTVYVNKQVYKQQFANVRAPNAVLTMRQAAFANGQSVRQTATPVRQAELAQLQTARLVAPPVTPAHQALVSAPAGRPIPRPAPQVAQRQVVARSTPPAPRVTTPTVPAAPPNVRQISAVRPVVVKPGERVGTKANVADVNRPNGTARPQPVAQPPVNPRTMPPNNSLDARPNNPASVPPGVRPVRPGNPSPAPTQRPAERAPQPKLQSDSPRTNHPEQRPNPAERSQPKLQQPKPEQQPVPAERSQPKPEQPKPEQPKHEAPPPQPEHAPPAHEDHGSKDTKK